MAIGGSHTAPVALLSPCAHPKSAYHAAPRFALCMRRLGALLNHIPKPPAALSRFNWDPRDMPTSAVRVPVHLGRPWPTNDFFIFSCCGISGLFAVKCTCHRDANRKPQTWHFQMCISKDRALQVIILALSFGGTPAMYSRAQWWPHGHALTVHENRPG